MLYPSADLGLGLRHASVTQGSRKGHPSVSQGSCKGRIVKAPLFAMKVENAGWGLDLQLSADDCRTRAWLVRALRRWSVDGANRTRLTLNGLADAQESRPSEEGLPGFKKNCSGV